MDHETYLFLLALAAGCLLFSIACMAAQAAYANLANRTVRTLRDRWFARLAYPCGVKTILVLAAGHDDLRDARNHVMWVRHFGRTALLLQSLVRPSLHCALWLLLAALVCCF